MFDEIDDTASKYPIYVTATHAVLHDRAILIFWNLYLDGKIETFWHFRSPIGNQSISVLPH